MPGVIKAHPEGSIEPHSLAHSLLGQALLSAHVTEGI